MAYQGFRADSKHANATHTQSLLHRCSLGLRCERIIHTVRRYHITHTVYATTLAASHALSPDLMLRNSAEPADGKHTELQHGKISSSLSRTEYTAHHSQTTRRASKPRVGARWSHASGNGLPLASIRKHCLQRYTLQTEQPYEERGTCLPSGILRTQKSSSRPSSWYQPICPSRSARA